MDLSSETKGELINGAVGLIGSIMKDRLVRRKEKELLEQRAEMDKEIAELRQRDLRQRVGDADGSEPVDRLRQAEQTVGDLNDMLDEAKQEEDCTLCADMIEMVSEQPLPVQQRALPELRQLLELSHEGASQNQLKDHLRDSETLTRVMQDSVDLDTGATEDEDQSSVQTFM